MTSRLDRLFILLETGTNSLTKHAAAEQLGQAQRLHPHELHHLLARVSVLLKSAQWDTRISAAHAVQAIISQVPVWEPVPSKNEEKSDLEQEANKQTKQNQRLTLDNFDMNHVLAQSSYLTGSEGSEYDLVVADSETVSAQDDKVVTEKLGFNPHLIGVHTHDLFTKDDLIPTTSSVYKIELRKMSIKETLQETVGLSRREINRARRKARQSISKQRSREAEDVTDAGSSNVVHQISEPLTKRVKVEDGDTGVWYNSSSTTVIDSRCAVPDGTGCWPESAVDWPFEAFAENLLQDLFSVKWEIRHGAATAFRELIKLHGRDRCLHKMRLTMRSPVTYAGQGLHPFLRRQGTAARLRFSWAAPVPSTRLHQPG